MKFTHYLAAFFLLAAGAAQADTLGLNLSNNVAQFEYSTASSPNAQGKADLHAGLLYNNAHSILVNGGVMVTNGMEAAPGTSVGVGMEAVAGWIKDNPMFNNSTATAVALDALVRYSPPSASQVGIAGELHYAPRILTFGDAVRYVQQAVRLEYEIAPQSVVYVGYRSTGFGLKNGPAVYMESGLNIGFKVSF